MFAAGLWDKLEETLHLFRDRAGEKPLYFGHIDSVLYFASELKFFTNLGSDISKTTHSSFFSFTHDSNVFNSIIYLKIRNTGD